MTKKGKLDCRRLRKEMRKGRYETNDGMEDRKVRTERKVGKGESIDGKGKDRKRKQSRVNYLGIIVST